MFPSYSHTTICELLEYSRDVHESTAIAVRSSLAYDNRKSVARTAMGLLPNILATLPE